MTQETAQILQFPARPTIDYRRLDRRSTTPTAENGRLRKDRREAWRRAEVLKQYWDAMLDMEHHIASARNHGVLPLSALHNLPYDRATILAKYREALVQYMLTPVFDLNGLKWKQEALAKQRYLYIGLTADRLKAAIAEDEAWLAAHPTRRTAGKEAVQ